MNRIKINLTPEIEENIRREAEEKNCSIAEIIRQKIELGYRVEKIVSFEKIVSDMRSEIENINQQISKEDENIKSEFVWIRYTLFLIFNCVIHLIKSSFEDPRSYSQFVVDMHKRLEDFKTTNKMTF